MERRLTAILAADVVGYSSLMGKDEEGTLAALNRHRAELFDPTVARHNGRIIKLMGDGVLVEFASAVNAVECALAIQNAGSRTADDPIRLRIGINVGDVIVDGDDLYGDGVNIAARVEGLAESGGIALSEFAYDQVARKVNIAFEDAGTYQLKNISDAVRIYRVASGPSPSDRTPGPARPEKPSIAVLAFTNMSGDPEQEYFSDGISEDIITELSRFQELFVIARNSSFSYKGKATKVQEIGEDLGVGYVVEGSVRKAGQRVRITVQLVEAATGNHMWAERYDRELEDIFDLQDQITQAIVTVLPYRLMSALAENVKKKPSGNLTAIECFMRARWLFDKASGTTRDKVLELLAKAIELDPGYGPAHALTAYIHSYSVYTFSPLGADPTIAAREFIERALALSEGDHYVHTQAANVYLTCGMHDLAQTHADNAVALNSNAMGALLIRGFISSYSGRPREGVEQLREALAHDPLAPDYEYEVLAETYYLLREYENAIEIYQRWRNPPVHMYTHLAACYAQLNRLDKACRAAETFEENRPKGSDFSFYATAHARLCKQPEDAEHWLEGYRKAGLID